MAAGLTQTELAGRTGIPQKTISNYETGARRGRAGMVRRIADALEVSAVSAAENDEGRSPETSSVVRKARTAVAGEATRAFEVVATGLSMEPRCSSR